MIIEGKQRVEKVVAGFGTKYSELAVLRPQDLNIVFSMKVKKLVQKLKSEEQEHSY